MGVKSLSKTVTHSVVTAGGAGDTLSAYLCVRQAQHGGQLPSVRLRYVLLHLEALLESFALQV